MSGIWVGWRVRVLACVIGWLACLKMHVGEMSFRGLWKYIQGSDLHTELAKI